MCWDLAMRVWRCGAGMLRRFAGWPGLPIVTIATSYGRVDCLLERGHRDWEQLRRGAGPVAVADVSVLVASANDAWALRRRFKG
jgi:hypothetical protein